MSVGAQEKNMIEDSFGRGGGGEGGGEEEEEEEKRRRRNGEGDGSWGETDPIDLLIKINPRKLY